MKDMPKNAVSPLSIPMKRTIPKSGRFHHVPQTDKGTEIWLLTLSDLLMLLMIFFVVLFGLELEHQRKTKQLLQATAGTQTKPQQQELLAHASVIPHPSPTKAAISASLEKELIAALNREKGEPDILIERIADLVILTFPERIVFDSGRAKIKPSAYATLVKVGTFIRERPYLAVEVQGHTDDRPINNMRYPSNWELSADRAMGVSKALIGLGVNPTRLSVKGYGEYRPHVVNDSNANRLKNRRVEIQFSILPQSETTLPRGRELN
jgi:chemotaxis protein MotB